MKKIKGRGILVMCLLVFGGYALYDFLAQKKAEEAKTASAKLFTMNTDQIDVIEISKSNGESVILKRSVEGWNLEQPLKDSADDASADDLIKMTSSERVYDVVKEGEGIDWKAFGLEQPAGSVKFTNSAGLSTTLHISGKTNFENNPFARRDNENRVLVVNSSWTTRLEKPVGEFRDRRFLRHKMASIEYFRLKNKSGIVEINLKEGKWVDAGSKKVELDQQKVRQLFRDIADARAANYIDGKMPTLNPLFTLNLKLGEQAWKAEVGQATDKRIYASVSEPKFQMLMGPGALDNLIDLKTEDLKVGATPKQDSKDQTGAQLAHEKDNL
ncbi:hypothetical protein DOM22_15175 [Bdellovibrio sp. ZAP7]|uniref:DUF4340 domain-containing protein n=1 Tax=Bdellovibrio sp. ZAP7 TaxID=2231053 RepID=UPI001159214C|nr:DUF4340 domain-containing protein [Bdellovibrio sp. ZAP7]QDK46411.1 hypothetical protein DOM22_15175 [Bdellovibrio sp. ZAP7]